MTRPTPETVELVPADYFRALRREEIFSNFERRLELDVGCGDGTFLMEMAARFPERNFLGIERLGGRVRKISRRAARLGLANARVLGLESSYALGWLLPEGCATRLHLLFPDPWPKKRHARHRFVHGENLATLHRVLASDGEFLFKTDHPDYFDEATAAVDESPLFSRLPWLDSGEFYAVTDFERQWMEEGKRIQGARWVKRPGSAT
ncbi:MAG: tRNA ((7)-)-methyltransferase [Verrucomicrobiales bacterium]|nr:tRNA ((7)-)-methyltransferase [Verrucomicrobiales bacterium]